MTTHRRTSHLRVVLGALVAAALLAIALAPASKAAGSTVVVVTDRGGDAHLSHRKALSSAEKKSIDIRKLTIRRVGSTTRFMVRVREVMRVRKFDQMFFINLRQRPSAPGGPWDGQVGITSKGRAGYAHVSNTDGTSYINCNVEVAVRPKRNEVVASVPRRCVPGGQVKVRMQAATGHFRTDAPVFSTDSIYVPGWPTIRAHLSTEPPTHG